MATTTPKPESILADVATKLALITVANSFRTTVASVDRQAINPEKIAGTKLPALAVFGEVLEYGGHGVGSTPRQEAVLRFKVQGILRLSATASPSTSILNFVQDVREKLFEDRSRGGYADNTHVSRIELGGEGFGNQFGSPPFVAPPFHGFLMEAEVHFMENL